MDTTRPHKGQTWKAQLYSYRHEVLGLVDVDDRQYVVHRWAEEGSVVEIDTVESFLSKFEDPQWPTPEPTTDTEYLLVALTRTGLLEYGESRYESIHAARATAVNLPAVVGVQRMTTTRTFEWVDPDESAAEPETAEANA